MEDKPESELTAWLESELRQISNLKAPPTLAPRVMRLIQARSRSAWWRQPFWDWSFQARAAFIGVLVAGVAFLVWAGWVGEGAWARLVFSSWQSCWVWHTLSGLGEGMITLTKAAMLFLEAAVPYWVIGIWAVVLVMNLYCLGLAAAFYRYVYKQIPARV